MRIHETVKKALERGEAVVALESTIISHGMPYPKNVETARLVEKTVRDNGAVPATIGIIDGEITELGEHFQLVGVGDGQDTDHHDGGKKQGNQFFHFWFPP